MPAQVLLLGIQRHLQKTLEYLLVTTSEHLIDSFRAVISRKAFVEISAGRGVALFGEIRKTLKRTIQWFQIIGGKVKQKLLVSPQVIEHCRFPPLMPVPFPEPFSK